MTQNIGDYNCLTMYTTKELQTILKCGSRTIYNLMHSKTFPSIKIGRKYFVEKNALENWLNKSKGKTIFF